MRIWRTAAAVLAVAAMTGCAHAPFGRRSPSGRVVEAEGWSPADSARPLQARERALAEAQRKAVEKAVGVSLSAVTRVDDAVTLRQEIEANVGGVIRSYDVLWEKEESGFVKVGIRALVLMKLPTSDEPGLVKSRREKVAVVASDATLRRAVKAALEARGYPLSEDAAAADIVITGTVEAYPLQRVGLGGLLAYRARASLDGLVAASGRQGHQAREASAVDPAAPIARQSAVADAGRLAADAVAAELDAAAGFGGKSSAVKGGGIR